MATTAEVEVADTAVLAAAAAGTTLESAEREAGTGEGGSNQRKQLPVKRPRRKRRPTERAERPSLLGRVQLRKAPCNVATRVSRCSDTRAVFTTAACLNHSQGNSGGEPHPRRNPLIRPLPTRRREAAACQVYSRAGIVGEAANGDEMRLLATALYVARRRRLDS